MTSKRVQNSITVGLLTGSLVCGGLLVYYATRDDVLHAHWKRWEGTLVPEVEPNRFRVRKDNNEEKDGIFLSPPFTLTPDAGMGAGSKITVWVYMPKLHTVKPAGPTPDFVIRILEFCLMGIGLVLAIQFLIRNLGPPSGYPSNMSMLFTGISAFVSCITGSLSVALFLKDGLEYEEVEGVVEAISTGRMRILFTDGTWTRDLMGAPPVVGHTVKMFRLKSPPVRTSPPDVFPPFLVLSAFAIILTAVLAIVFVVLDWLTEVPVPVRGVVEIPLEGGQIVTGQVVGRPYGTRWWWPVRRRHPVRVSP
jgi:hypothetical protein